MNPQHLVAALLFSAGLAVGIAASGGVRTSLGIIQAGKEASGAAFPTPNAELRSTEPAAGADPNAQSARPDEEQPRDYGSHEPSRLDLELEGRFQAMSSAWTRLQGEVASLRIQVADLRQRLSDGARPPGESEKAAAQGPSPDSSEGRRLALIAAGVSEEQAADLVWLQGQQELERMELYDTANREGWFGTDRYREQASRIDRQASDLRQAIGDDAYDRYLFSAGTDNRVQIDSVIPGSTAEDAGLQIGDMVEAYAGRRVFDYSDLRSATLEGERDELVPVRIRRGEAMIDVWIPRGPLGVRLEAARSDPEA